MMQHLSETELMPKLQSAYRRHHSTETVLVKVLSDVLDAADAGQVTLLGLLDLSAAFDTVNHHILIQRLWISFGFDGVALQWIESFLSGQVQAIAFHDSIPSSDVWRSTRVSPWPTCVRRVHG